MTIHSRSTRFTVVLLCGAVLMICGAALALTNNLLAGGTIANSQLFNGPATIRMAQVILNPGDTIPWHYHPGRAYVIVKTGTVTEEFGCGGTEQHSAGDAFEETTQTSGHEPGNHSSRAVCHDHCAGRRRDNNIHGRTSVWASHHTGSVHE